MSIAQLKTLNLDRIDLDEAISLWTEAEQLTHGYAALKLAQPTWLTAVQDTLNDEIARRTRDNLRARLASIRAQRESLKTADEKRKALDAEAAEIENALGA